MIQTATPGPPERSLQSVPPPLSDYERGLEAGKITSRLNDHDDHFERINGSVDRLASAYEKLLLEVRAVAESQRIEAAKSVVAAAALAKDRSDREHVDDERWSKRERWLGVGMFLIVLANLVVLVIPH